MKLRWCIVASLLIALSGCGIVGGQAPNIDAKGFGGDPTAQKAVEGAVRWILNEVLRISSRNFALTSDALEYYGSDRTLVATVAELRSAPGRFGAFQELLSTVMRASMLVTFLRGIEVRIVTPEAVATLAGVHDEAAFVGNRLSVTRRKVESFEDDPRALIAFVAHHVLHGFGFGTDGSLAGRPVAVPSALQVLPNALLVDGIATLLVLFSSDYRFPLDGLDSPTGWQKLVDDVFGGPGGVPLAAAPVSAAFWNVDPAQVQRQVDGYMTNATAAAPADAFAVTSVASRRDLRVSLELVPTQGAWTRTFTVVGRATFRGNYNSTEINVAGTGPFGSCSGSVPATPRAEFAVSFLGEVIVARINGKAVCEVADSATAAPRSVTLQGNGLRVDRARIDGNPAE